MASDMASASAHSFSSWLAPSESDFAFQGIYVHPSHFAASPPPPDVSSPSSIMSYLSEDQDEDLPMVQGLALESIDSPAFLASPDSFDWSSSSSSSTPSESPSPLFPSHFSTLSPHTVFPDTSPISSGCSTPTTLLETSSTKASISSAAKALSSCTASPHSTRPLTLDVSPKFLQDIENLLASSSFRSTPSSSGGGPPSEKPRRASRASLMLRSVSTPVESQRQLDDRKRNLKAVGAVMTHHVESTGMGRHATVGAGSHDSVGAASSSSSSSTPFTPFNAINEFVPPPFARQSSTPNPNFFSAGWGESLPSRHAANPTPDVPFPYNLLVPSAPPVSRAARSASVTCMSSSYATPARHVSLPGISRAVNGFPLSIVTSSPVLTGRTRRTTLTPLTPLIPTTIELPPCAMTEASRPKLQSRGFSC